MELSGIVGRQIIRAQRQGDCGLQDRGNVRLNACCCWEHRRPRWTDQLRNRAGSKGRRGRLRPQHVDSLLPNKNPLRFIRDGWGVDERSNRHFTLTGESPLLNNLSCRWAVWSFGGRDLGNDKTVAVRQPIYRTLAFWWRLVGRREGREVILFAIECVGVFLSAFI